MSLWLVMSLTLVGFVFLGGYIIGGTPADWLSSTNPHRPANLLRAAALFLGGLDLGMAAFVFWRSWKVESLLTGGHPRQLLYRHVTTVTLAHMGLILATLTYVRDRIDQHLTVSTPIAATAFFVSFLGSGLLLGYENSRLHAATRGRELFGFVFVDQHARSLVITPVGSSEPMSIDDLLAVYPDGEVVRVTLSATDASYQRATLERWGLEAEHEH